MSPRNIILILLFGLIIIIAAYRLAYPFLFYPALGFGFLIMLYAASIRCKYCGRYQVFRGYSIFSIRLPSEKCYNCKLPLKDKSNTRKRKEKGVGDKSY